MTSDDDLLTAFYVGMITGAASALRVQKPIKPDDAPAIANAFADHILTQPHLVEESLSTIRRTIELGGVQQDG